MLQQILGGGEVEFEDFIGGSAGAASMVSGARVGAGGGERVGQVFGRESGEGRIGGGGRTGQRTVLARQVWAVWVSIGLGFGLPEPWLGVSGWVQVRMFADEGGPAEWSWRGPVSGEHGVGAVVWARECPVGGPGKLSGGKGEPRRVRVEAQVCARRSRP